MGKQTFVALRCFECLKFSVQLQKKSGKWACAACGTRQSALRCFAVSDVASDVRGVVARLNAVHGALTDEAAAAAALGGDAEMQRADGSAPEAAAAAAANHGGGGGGASRVRWDAFVDDNQGWGEIEEGGGGSDGDHGGGDGEDGHVFVTALPARPRLAAGGRNGGGGVGGSSGGGGGGGSGKRIGAIAAGWHGSDSRRYKRARPQDDLRVGSGASAGGGGGHSGFSAPWRAPPQGAARPFAAPVPAPVPSSFRPQQQQQLQQQQQQQQQQHDQAQHQPQQLQHHHHQHQQQRQQQQAGIMPGGKPSAWDAFVGGETRGAAEQSGSGDEDEGAAVARAWGTEW